MLEVSDDVILGRCQVVGIANTHDLTVELRTLGGELLNIFAARDNRVLDFAFSANGSHLSSPCDDANIRKPLWPSGAHAPAQEAQ